MRKIPAIYLKINMYALMLAAIKGLTPEQSFMAVTGQQGVKYAPRKPVDIEQLRGFRAKGYSYRKIATLTGVPYHKVLYWITKEGKEAK